MDKKRIEKIIELIESTRDRVDINEIEIIGSS